MDLEIISKMLACSSEAELETQFIKVLNRLGVHHFAYFNIPNTDNIAPKVITNYPTAWVTHWVENHYERVDSTVALCKVTNDPFTWSFSREVFAQNSLLQCYWEEATQFDLKDGISISLPSIGCDIGFGYALNKNENSDLWLKSHKETMKVLSNVFYSQLNLLTDASRSIDLNAQMSARELECAQWVSTGMTAIQVAEKMNITERTVRFHLEQLKFKLNVKTKEQVIVMLAYHRLINV
jgi:LuxR family transcriptional activator of conjugal transfer of Ti plasmids